MLAYAFLDEFVLLYPLYTLLFADAGLTPGQISSLLVVWSVTSVVLEVPTGALADAASRRALLVAGPLLGAAGFGLWVAAPGYAAFAAGFVLWGAKSALVSGALEALVYDELLLAGEADRFAALLGRAQAAAAAAVVGATALAAPVVAAAGYAGVGAASVAAGLLCALVALAFPEHHAGNGRAAPRTGPDDATDDDDGAALGYVGALRLAVAEVVADRGVRRLVVLLAVAAGVWGALEEYTGLVAVDSGVPVAEVPWWELVIWTAVTFAALAAGTARRLRAPALAGIVAVATAALAAGAASGRPAGLVLVAVAFGGFQLLEVVLAARLQSAVRSAARATVTSFAAVVTEGVAVGVYALYGLLAGALGVGIALAALGLLHLPLAWALLRERESR